MIYYTLCSNMLDNVTAAFSFAFVASSTEKSDVHLTSAYWQVLVMQVFLRIKIYNYRNINIATQLATHHAYLLLNSF